MAASEEHETRTTKTTRRAVMIDERLEAEVMEPTGTEESEWVAVVTHPHPKMGGSMQNNVTVAVCQALLREGVLCVRFNTRGVGRSLGDATWRGVDEREDIAAALRFAVTIRPRVIFVGYSFGAAVGLSVLAMNPPPVLVSGACLIGYPKGFFAGVLFSQHYSHADPGEGIPKLFVLGDNDNFSSVSTLQDFVRDSISTPAEVSVIDGCDHFFFGQEGELQRRLVAWFREVRTSQPALS